MSELEQLLGLFIAAVILAAAARRVGAPYPVFLALGGAALAVLPTEVTFTLPPELALALFIAPVLLDAAYDASLRDLKDNWAPVTGLVVFAVGLTTAAVAIVAHTLVPAMPWPAAIALGAIVAPPDAVAATAVLRPLHPPHRLLTILEGESLLNDASALLIYRLAVGAAAAGSFSAAEVAPAFLFAVAGSLVAGPALGWLLLRSMSRVQHVPTAIILQFITTFGVWIVAEHLGLSAVLTTVCFAIFVAQSAPQRTPARLRIPAYAVWETVVFALNILAFIFIGLQIRPILANLEPGQVGPYSRRGRRRPADRDHRALCLAHAIQRRRAMATPPGWFPSAAARCCGRAWQRPAHLVGRHARHRFARHRAGAPAAVPVSRLDHPGRVLRRPRHPGDPGADAEVRFARARSA